MQWGVVIPGEAHPDAGVEGVVAPAALQRLQTRGAGGVGAAAKTVAGTAKEIAAIIN